MQEMWFGVYCNPWRERGALLLRTKDGTKEIVSLEVKSMAQLGKRYHCDECETEILCTKAGDGDPVCCEKEMKLQEPRPLPSSD